MMGILEVKNVNKRLEGLQALGDVNLSVAENSVHLSLARMVPENRLCLIVWWAS